MPDPQALQAILDRTGDAATVAWAHDGQGDVSRLADPALAIVAAERLGNVAALQAVSAPKDLRKAASAALHRIKSRGVKFEEKVAPRAVVLGKEKSDLASRAFLSLPDREGDLELLLTASDDSGNCVLGMILGPDGAVREVNHAHVNRSELRDLWKRAEGRPDHAELPFTSGLHYAEKWLGATHHDWKHFCDHVASGTLQSARLLDPLQRAPAAEDTDAEGGDWNLPARLLDEGAMGVGVQKLVGVLSSPIEEAPEAKNARLDDIVRDVADAALTARTRPQIARSAELTALALRFHKKGGAADRVADVARQVEAGVPGRDIDAVLHAVRLALVIEATGRMYGMQQGG